MAITAERGTFVCDQCHERKPFEKFQQECRRISHDGAPTIEFIRLRWPKDSDFDWIDTRECDVLHVVELADGWLLIVGTTGVTSCEWVHLSCDWWRSRHSNAGYHDLAACLRDGLIEIVGPRGEDPVPDAMSARWEIVEGVSL